VNPFDLSASDLLIWGIVLHLIADWPLQNDWMANHKMHRRVRGVRHGDGLMTPPQVYQPKERWWDRHPAAYVHAGIHGVLLAIIFGWVAIPLAVIHLVIDTRTPVVKWSKLIRQTQPQGNIVRAYMVNKGDKGTVSLYDVGTEVRFWTDQVFHIACVAIAALLSTL
jgi:hypothetical protein